MDFRVRIGKYNAVKTKVEGITFDSKREAARYQELRLLERAGEIENLSLQAPFSLSAWSEDGPVHICRYIADFVYNDLGSDEHVVEDSKGFRTPLYRLKKKWMAAQYGIVIRET